MFSERLKGWIYKQLKKDYSGNIHQDVELFEKCLSLKAPDETLEGINVILPKILEEMSSAPDIEYIKERMDRFAKVEPFLRHLLGILYPKRYRTAPKYEKNGLQASEWTFAPLLKQAFEIVPKDYNISQRKPEYISFPYKDSYDLVYESKNKSSHDFIDMSQEETFKLVNACLIVYLDVSSRLCLQIEEAFSKENIDGGFFAIKYCREIINEYKQRIENGFTYVDIKWKSNNSGNAEYSTVDTIMNDNSSHLIKLLGEAGCGKTTIMRQLEYLTAKNYIDKKTTIIPVLISLGNIETDSALHADIKTMISKKLGIELDLLEDMLSLNTLCLYLDGFNEILDIKLKKQIAWSIDDLAKQYPDLTIFLSDRSLVRSAIDTMRDALIYRLYPLDNKMKETFIRYNCPDSAIKEMLLNHFNENPYSYENFTTPIKLKQLIELAIHQKGIPQNFDAEYIKFLFNREMIEKNDENVEYLESFACTLAIHKDEKLAELKAEACLAKCKQILGHTIPDSRKCLRLLIDMGILTLEDGYIEFKHSSYRDYFWMTACNNQLMYLLEEKINEL